MQPKPNLMRWSGRNKSMTKMQTIKNRKELRLKWSRNKRKMGMNKMLKSNQGVLRLKMVVKRKQRRPFLVMMLKSNQNKLRWKKMVRKN